MNATVSAFNQAADIFGRAIELPEPDRAEFVRSACADNASLRAMLDSMLAAHARQGAFLADDSVVTTDMRARGRVLDSNATSKPDAAAGDATAIAGHVERAGARIGPYKLLQQIGEGGFGAVFMAEQEHPVRRRVALKIVKLGMDTRQVVARFEQERQALAMMEHAHIAKVLDAGATEQGRPFFVMELCSGDPITEYCDKHNLSISERLSLFVQVCQAVQHAHQKGLIHRDIKPSNILVSTQDGRPHAKVIDFGIAKATAARLTEKTLFTEHKQFIGTPQYMSPEQAEGSLDIDTRTDVYSLGVLLYELLTGVTPFDPKSLRSAAYAEVQRIIREVAPPRPSTRLSQNAATLVSIAASRQTEPKKLGTIIRGELDWIVMKALEKDRQRRYDSANGLALDVQRFLANEPVLAAPPSAAYRARTFLRRHRAAVVMASVVASAILIGLVFSITGFVQASRARDRAEVAHHAEQAARLAADAQRSRADEQAERLRQELYISQIGRAQHLIETGGTEPIKPILAACDSGLRGWEWERLSWLADRSDRTLQAHQKPNWYNASAAAYSSDGRRFLTFGDGHLVRLWDAESFRMLLEIPDPDRHAIGAAVISPDGAYIVAGTYQSQVHVFDAGNGRLAATYKFNGQSVRSVAISPGNTRVAAGGWLGDTNVWDFQTGERIRELTGSMSRGEALQFSADGSKLLVGSLGNDVALVDTVTWNTVVSERGAGFVVLDAALSHDGKKIASVGEDSRLWVRDAGTGRLLYSVAGSKGALNAVAFHPDGDYIAVGSDDGVIFFDSTNGEKLGSLTGHDAAVIGVSFHPQGRFLLSIDNLGVVKRWHLGVRQAVTVYSGTMSMNAAAFSHDGTAVCLGTSDDGMRLLDARTLEVQNPGSQPIVQVGVGGVIVSPDGSSVAALGSTRVWGDKDGQNTVVLFDRLGRVQHQWMCPYGVLVFSPDSRLVGSGEEEGALVVRDVQSAKIVRKVPYPKDATACSTGGENSTLIVGHADGTVRVVDLETGSAVRTLSAHGKAVNVVLMAPQRDTLITGSLDENRFKVWDWPSGNLRHQFDDAGLPQSAAVSPDGRRLVAGGNALTLPLWDVRTGRRLLTVGQHTSAILSVAFSPDGRTIASCGYDHALRVWETQMPSAIELDKRYNRDVERRAVRRELILELDHGKSSP